MHDDANTAVQERAHWVRSWGVQRTLWVGFSAIGVLMAVALALTWRAGLHVKQELQAVVDQGIPSLQASYEISIDVGTVARSLRDAVLVEMQEELPIEAQRVTEANKRIELLMGELEKLATSEESKAALSRVPPRSGSFLSSLGRWRTRCRAGIAYWCIETVSSEVPEDSRVIQN